MILLTGASGYLGRYLLANLVEQQLSVTTAGRRPVDAGVAHRHCDLHQAGGFRDLTGGMASVLHCAGIAHNNGAHEEYQEVNVKGAMSLAEAAVANGACRFVYISSLNIVPVDAIDPTAPAAGFPQPSDPYSASKWRAEQSLEALLAHSGTQLIIVRPALIYDRELTANLASLASLVSRLPFALPPRGGRCMVSRPDLVRLLVGIVSRNHSRFDVGSNSVVRLAVTDGHHYSARRIGNTLIGHRGIYLPDVIWRLGAGFRDRSQGLPMGSTWRSIAAPHWVGVAPVIDGWQPEYSFESCRRLADATRVRC